MYMAPEQAKGEVVDHRCDLFALGVIAYELLAGAPPFEGTGLEVIVANITQEPPSIATRSWRRRRSRRSRRSCGG